MSLSTPPERAPDGLVCHYRSGGAVRSRNVSALVLSSVLDVPAPPLRLVADWERDTASHLALEPGDVEPLSLARARARWPAYARCVQAVSAWTHALGLADVLAESDVALMTCRGARYHHDAAQYGGAAFCNLFVSDDKGLEVHFPNTGQRIALVRGTALIFDTGQPHAVVPRGSDRFDPADFAPAIDCTQVFLTWELPMENADVARALGIAFDTDPSTASQLQAGQLRLHGARAEVCPRSGRWQPAGYGADTST